MIKKIYIIGNWKSNKRSKDVESWFAVLAEKSKQTPEINTGNITIILCVPFPYLALAKRLLDNYQLPIHLAAQNISAYTDGAYTGEVTAGMIKEYADYILIGHSERRKYNKEDDQTLSEKVKRTRESSLEPIFCIPDAKTPIPEGVKIVAYEPVWAIGTGKADTPENAGSVAAIIRKQHPVDAVIYGGSVTAANVMGFLADSSIDGVLPGGASLDPNSFWEMICNAATFKA